MKLNIHTNNKQTRQYEWYWYSLNLKQEVTVKPS